MEDQEQILKENREEILKIRAMIQENNKLASYAGVVAGPAKRPARKGWLTRKKRVSK